MIVSVALSKHRIEHFKKVVESLLNQTLKPEKIEVFVSKDKFFLDDGIVPEDLPDLPVEYNYVDNTGLQRTYVPCVKKYWDKPDTKILVINDDRIFHENDLRNYFKYSLKYPNKALGYWGWSYKQTNKGNHVLNSSRRKSPIYTDIIIPSCGVLIKPKFFKKEDIWNWERFNTDKIDVRITDETFLSYCLARNNVDRILIPSWSMPKRLDKKDKKKITNRGTSYYKDKVKPSKYEQRKKWRKVLESGKAWDGL